jgi:hypothetical protein
MQKFKFGDKVVISDSDGKTQKGEVIYPAKWSGDLGLSYVTVLLDSGLEVGIEVSRVRLA